MPIARLPPEIIAEMFRCIYLASCASPRRILSKLELGDDESRWIPDFVSLYVCALVCHEWCALAQPLLFSFVCLLDHQTIETFLRTMREKAELRHVVHEMVLVLGTGPTTTQHFVGIMHVCPMLSHLSIYRLPIIGLQPVGAQLGLDAQVLKKLSNSTIPPVKTLAMSLSGSTKTEDYMPCQLIELFAPTIHTLTIGGSALIGQFAFKTPPCLRLYEFVWRRDCQGSDTSHISFIKRLLATSIGHLRVVALDMSVIAVLSILREHAAHLHSLKFSSKYRHDIQLAGSLLSTSTELQELIVVGGAIDKCITQYIPRLQHIALNEFVTEGEEDGRLSQLATILDGFKNLQVITSLRAPSAELRQECRRRNIKLRTGLAVSAFCYGRSGNAS
jgi:hypothetical protein